MRASSNPRERGVGDVLPFVVSCLLGACGSDGHPTPARAVPQQHTSRTTGTERPPPNVPGAAAELAHPAAPADLEPLTARYTPTRLPIPSVDPGRSATFSFDNGKQGWFARTPDGAQRLLTPAYGRGRVFVGGGFRSHQVYAYDAENGRMEWVSAAPDGGPTAALVEGDKLAYNTESCTLFVIDIETGRTVWSLYLGDPLMSQPAAANDLIFSGHIGGFDTGWGFAAMLLANGARRWDRAISADVLNAPVLDDQHIYFTTVDGVLWKLDQRSGRTIWQRQVNATSAPWLEGDVIHVARLIRSRGERAKEQNVVVSKASGEVVRSVDPVEAAFVPTRPDGGTMNAWQFEGSRPAIIDGRMYQAIGNEIQARDPETGTIVWRRRYTDRASSRPASPPAVAGSQLVVGTEDGRLYGLDIDTGMTTWAYEVGEPIASQPIVAHGWVYASTSRGGLVGLHIGDSNVGGWHMWGGNARHNGLATEAPGDAPGAADRDPTEGVLQLAGEPRRGELAGFPLQGTRVSGRVSGSVSRVEVEQTFTNPYERAVEAVYLFPLPDDAAVDSMEMHIGERVVRGNIREREQGQREYRAARDRGVLASILEQERPNLFRQTIANVRPGDSVRVVLKYFQSLPYEAGSYRFVFPMVAGPRYTPQQADDASEPATNGSDTHQVVLAPGGERPDRVHFSLEIDAGMEIADVTSSTHAISVERPRSGGATARFADAQGVRPDRDLDVRFRVAGAVPNVSVLSSPPATGDRGFVSMVIHPRLNVPDSETTPRELVFVVDTSSSMRGKPMEIARAAMVRALDGLRPEDTFRVVRFSDTAGQLSETPLQASRENIERGKRYVNGLSALGATEMSAGLLTALDPPIDGGRMRIVVLVTDGYIGNETEVFRDVHEHLGSARVFGFGVGGAVNRYLLSRIAEIGRGDVQVVTLDESPQAAADEFHARIGRPYLTDVSIDWGGLDVADVYPRRIPDLFADRPLTVHGRFQTGGEGAVTVRGLVAGQPFEQRVAVTLSTTAQSGATGRQELTSLWARRRIEDLMLAMALQPNDEYRQEVTDIGLRYSLLTQWTAFVAIDEGYRTGNAPAGSPPRVNQPSETPSGVEWGAPPQAQQGAVGDVGGMGGMGAMAAIGSASGYGSGYGIGYGSAGVIGTGRGGGGGAADTVGAFGASGLAPVATPTLTVPVNDMVQSVRSESAAAPEPPTRRLTKNVPMIRTGAVEVRGSLSTELIRRVIHRHLSEVRFCYEQALIQHPALAGRVTVAIVISSTGAVQSATVASTTLSNERVESCVAGAVRRWTFPAVGGAPL